MFLIKSNRLFRPIVRTFSNQLVFDTEVKRIQRDNVAKIEDMKDYQYIRDDMTEDLLDRLSDMKREFPVAVDLACTYGTVYQKLNGRGHIKKLYQCDPSFEMLQLAKKNSETVQSDVKTEFVQIDDDFLPFKDNSVDCVISSLYMHWINDIDKHMSEIYRILKIDGLFLGVLYGGNTLKELRHCLEQAEMKVDHTLSVHVSPLLQPSTLSSIVSNAGFVGATVDAVNITAEYRDIYQLMTHLRKMGENNACQHRKMFVSKAVFDEADKLYKSHFKQNENTIKATFNPIFITAWKPDPKRKVLNPQKPTKSLNEILNEFPMPNVNITDATSEEAIQKNTSNKP